MNDDTSILSALAGAPMSIRRRALNRCLLRLPVASRRRAQYLLAHGELLRLRRPETWTEKINWRMVFDRRELIAMTCDKLATKAWVEQMATPDVVTVPRTCWAGDDPRALLQVRWPASWVLKPNHGTGLVQLGHGTPNPSRLDELMTLAGRWLVEPGPEIWGEWGYGRARRLVLLEEAVPGTPETGRTDYKFYVTGGSVRLVQIDTGRFGRHRREYLTPEGLRVDDRSGEATRASAPPAGWDDMIQVAGKLGSEFDAIRVDLYLQDSHPWFGELTAYDGSGLFRFPVRAIDQQLGRSWHLPVPFQPFGDDHR